MKNLNGYIKWIGVTLAILAIIWNAIELHYNTKKNTAVLQNDVAHLTSDIVEIKQDVKELNRYLLERSNQ